MNSVATSSTMRLLGSMCLALASVIAGCGDDSPPSDDSSSSTTSGSSSSAGGSGGDGGSGGSGGDGDGGSGGGDGGSGGGDGGSGGGDGGSGHGGSGHGGSGHGGSGHGGSGHGGSGDGGSGHGGSGHGGSGGGDGGSGHGGSGGGDGGSGDGGSGGDPILTEGIYEPQATNDAEDVYYRFEYVGEWEYFRAYVDIDADPSTGFTAANGFGGDYLIEGAGIHEYTGTDGTNEWSWEYVASATFVNDGASVEWTVPRALIGETEDPNTALIVYQVENFTIGSRVTAAPILHEYSAP